MHGALGLAALVACARGTPEETREDAPAPAGLAYFGYTLVDVGYDDPLDPEVKVDYVDEVAPFTNLADILVVAPSDDVRDRLQRMADHELAAVLHLHELFFSYAGEGGRSGARYDLRPDYAERWADFVAVNDLTARADQLGALYIGEEPTWNDIDLDELTAAADLLQETLPTVPILVVEAYPAVDDLRVPPAVDWVGFDHYFVPDVTTDTDFLRELAVVRAARSTPEQRLVLILDAHYIPWAHGAAGLTEADMADVAARYADLARATPEVVALIGYTWPGGFDDPEAKGARELPAALAEHRRIGAEITGK